MPSGTPDYRCCSCAGNRFAFARVLQKFLHGLKSSLDGDLSNHAVVVGMNKGAKSICDGLRARYSHHCVLSSSWSGHETEEGAVRKLPKYAWSEQNKPALRLPHNQCKTSYGAIPAHLWQPPVRA